MEKIDFNIRTDSVEIKYIQKPGTYKVGVTPK